MARGFFIAHGCAGLSRSRLFRLRRASARARYRAAAIRPCLGCASVNLISLTAVLAAFLYRSRLFLPPAGPPRGRATARRPFGLASAAPRLACVMRICLPCCWFISLTAVSAFGGPARARAIARRPFGLASAAPRLARVMRICFAELRRLPRIARLAIEARPKGRARAGPAEGRNSRERKTEQSETPMSKITTLHTPLPALPMPPRKSLPREGESGVPGGGGNAEKHPGADDAAHHRAVAESGRCATGTGHLRRIAKPTGGRQAIEARPLGR